MTTPLPQRTPENVSDDFYVERDCCLRCCLPHSEAPVLLDDPDAGAASCHFRRQPGTEEEVDRAIRAIRVSCVGGLRYGGHSPKIIDRLRELGCAEQCDHAPESNAGARTNRPSLAELPLEVPSNWILPVSPHGQRQSWWRWLFRRHR